MTNRPLPWEYVLILPEIILGPFPTEGIARKWADKHGLNHENIKRVYHPLHPETLQKIKKG